MGRYAFPHNERLAHLSYPKSASHHDVITAHRAFKDEIVTTEGAGGFLRTRRPDTPDGQPDSTVSEGISYGMLISVMMDDQLSFDAFFKYADRWSNDNGLMSWYISADGSCALGTGAASDADEDIAWALVMASQKWGGSGSLSQSYEALALRQINRIWEFEVDHDRWPDMFLPGDEWRGKNVFNPSYFAPNQYRIFGELSGNTAGWNRVIDRGYEILDRCLNEQSGNRENGLVPAWCDFQGRPVEAFPGAEQNFQTDSARLPFRIILDWAESRDPRAKAYLDRISSFFAQQGASQIIDGYDLNGTPRPDRKTLDHGEGSAVFVGCAAAGAMCDSRFQSLVDDGYERVKTGRLLARSRYYNHCWTVMTLLMMTGNFSQPSTASSK
jgi:endoglucanase